MALRVDALHGISQRKLKAFGTYQVKVAYFGEPANLF
jgi:hypothetical protein